MPKFIVNLTIQGTIETEESPVDSNFAKQLRLRRLTEGLTIHQLSKSSGISASHITRIERGERAPGYRVVVKLREALEDKING